MISLPTLQYRILHRIRLNSPGTATVVIGVNEIMKGAHEGGEGEAEENQGSANATNNE